MASLCEMSWVHRTLRVGGWREVGREGRREGGRGEGGNEKTYTHWVTIRKCVCTFLDIPGHLVAGGTDTEPTLGADPVEVEESCITCVTHLPQSLHCPLPDWGH